MLAAGSVSRRTQWQQADRARKKVIGTPRGCNPSANAFPLTPPYPCAGVSLRSAADRPPDCSRQKSLRSRSGSAPFESSSSTPSWTTSTRRHKFRHSHASRVRLPQLNDRWSLLRLRHWKIRGKQTSPCSRGRLTPGKQSLLCALRFVPPGLTVVQILAAPAPTMPMNRRSAPRHVGDVSPLRMLLSEAGFVTTVATPSHIPKIRCRPRSVALS